MLKYCVLIFTVAVLLLSCKPTLQEQSTEHEANNEAQAKAATPAEPLARRAIDQATTVTTAELATIALFEEASPSVCFINTSNFKRDYWSRNVEEIPRGTGSGFVWDVKGHVVTNYHVIEGASRITVTLANLGTYEAKLVGSEPNKDLASIEARGYRCRSYSDKNWFVGRLESRTVGLRYWKSLWAGSDFNYWSYKCLG